MKTFLRLFLAVSFVAIAFSASAQENSLSDSLRAEIERAKTAALVSANIAIQQAAELAGGKEYSDESGILVAQGDSWYAYPFYNVLTYLEARHHYRVESVAHNGEWLDSMAYDPNQLSGLAHAFKKLRDKKKRPRAILLSGGGNDIAGPQLTLLLTHRRSGEAPLDEKLVREVVERRLRIGMLALIAATSHLCREYFDDSTIPIFIHGYSYPVPDGRGYLGGMWFLPGPWLRPAFDTKGYAHSRNDLQIATDAMRKIIADYNDVLQGVPALAKPANVHYIRVINTLTNDLDKYRDDWGNELHPTPKGFGRVADVFATELGKYSKP